LFVTNLHTFYRLQRLIVFLNPEPNFEKKFVQEAVVVHRTNSDGLQDPRFL